MSCFHEVFYLKDNIARTIFSKFQCHNLPKKTRHDVENISIKLVYSEVGKVSVFFLFNFTQGSSEMLSEHFCSLKETLGV